MMSTKKKPKKPKHLAKTNPSKNKLTAVHQSFSGPVPHPELLKDYNEIIPNAAERIFVMAERDAMHQHSIETMALQCASKEAKRGQWFGLIIGVCAFASAIAALVLGSESTAMVIGGSTVVGLVTVFVVGRKPQVQDINNLE
jgi:uncharacterized membrane protein